MYLVDHGSRGISLLIMGILWPYWPCAPVLRFIYTELRFRNNYTSWRYSEVRTSLSPPINCTLTLPTHFRSVRWVRQLLSLLLLLLYRISSAEIEQFPTDTLARIVYTHRRSGEQGPLDPRRRESNRLARKSASSDREARKSNRATTRNIYIYIYIYAHTRSTSHIFLDSPISLTRTLRIGECVLFTETVRRPHTDKYHTSGAAVASWSFSGGLQASDRSAFSRIANYTRFCRLLPYIM